MDALHKIFPLLSEHFQTDEFCSHSQKYCGATNVSLFIDTDTVRRSDGLLFQAAVSACRERKQVTLIHRHQVTALPPSVHGMPRPEPSVMAHLKIMYLSDITELISYFAKLHITGCPDMIAVCGLDQYLADAPEHKEQRITRLCAVMADASGFMKNKSNGGSMVIASTCEISSAAADIYARFCDPVYTVHQGLENDEAFEVSQKVNDTEQDAIKITAYTKDNQIFMKDLLLLKRTKSS